MTRYKTLMIGLLLAATATAAHAEAPAGYSLVWSDEFDSGTVPDPAKWSFDTQANAQKWWHDEAEYYTANRPENARIEDGYLVIEVRKEDTSAMPGTAGQLYTSARLITEGKAQWTHGFVEVRAKLPCNRGGWPAIWLLGPKWPAGGEIDIMEQLGFDSTTIYGTLHSPASEGGGQATPSGDKTTVADACTAFHLYQTQWTADGISILVDGQPYYHLDRPDKATAENWPFDTPESLILNVAMGGGWAGQKGIDDSALPAHMEVDYVRVYQKP